MFKELPVSRSFVRLHIVYYRGTVGHCKIPAREHVSNILFGLIVRCDVVSFLFYDGSISQISPGHMGSCPTAPENSLKASSCMHCRCGQRPRGRSSTSCLLPRVRACMYDLSVFGLLVADLPDKSSASERVSGDGSLRRSSCKSNLLDEVYSVSWCRLRRRRER